MKIKNYEKLGETLYTDVLPNGLTVYYLPKADFHKTYGLFTTNFGSLDVRFDETTYPEGIAHFLEHKLFEKADGDVMYKFGALGADTNAFTSFNRTAYLFSTVENVADCTELLLDFVQEPYFTAENVEKEQGIITQEIQMYQDEPDWRLYAGLLAALYPNSPLAADIAGTPTSIGEITAEMLYTNHQAFYQPANMNLFLTGNFEINEISELVRKNQAKKEFQASKLPRRAVFLPSAAITCGELTLDVAQPKVAFGLRGETKISDVFDYRLALQLFLALNFGKTSAFYQENYAAGTLDDSFSYELEMDGSGRFHCIIFSCDTENPENFVKILKNALKNYKIEPEKLALIKKQMLGAHFASLNSLEYIANEFAAMPAASDKTIFEFPEVLAQLTAEKIAQFSENFLKNAQESQFQIIPKIK
ncbi:MAG: insulinase family protein [Streptococcaceae bacterium]|jgi:predicted Zn-dependent peptidase|nr:insulinase family protein [Streptococcaceae bacterium]